MCVICMLAWTTISKYINIKRPFCFGRGKDGQVKPIWRSNAISFASKFKSYKTLVTSILLHSCETWTLFADFEKTIQAFETRFVRISYSELKTNDWVRDKIKFLGGPQKPPLETIKRRKLSWFGHITRHDSLSKTIFQGTPEGGRCLGRQRKCRMDNIRVDIPVHARIWLMMASRRKDWNRISSDSSLMSPDDNWSSDWTERQFA